VITAMRFIMMMLFLVSCATSATPPAQPEGRGKQPATLGKDGAIPLLRLDGTPANLSDYGAEVMVIAMWATWCGPCVEELPMLEALHQTYKGDRRVSIVAVSIDSSDRREKVRKIASGLSYPVSDGHAGRSSEEAGTGRCFSP
jgi:thiol-disulfide isomerase/thioredoxin